ncbi:hypothetical protein [Puia sp.]|uniref:hypothetical protein n=1 Tax=Puia sp. TaxID=2045100 RepID=UPI002F42A9F1
MKRFLLLRDLRRAIRTGKPLKFRGSFYKKGETYPLYVSDRPINKDDPFYKMKAEEADRFFKNLRLPDYLVERMNAR